MLLLVMSKKKRKKEKKYSQKDTGAFPLWGNPRVRSNQTHKRAVHLGYLRNDRRGSSTGDDENIVG